MITSLSIGTGGLGRMGNQMFTIAGCIGIAVKSGQSYAFPEWKTHDNDLFGQPVDNINEHLLNPLPLIPDNLTWKEYGYFWGYRDVYLPHDNWTIDAHMQSPKFFEHCMGRIRQAFTFKDEPEQNDYVAIHYRAGDYIDDDNAHHPRCSKEYYERAMDIMSDFGMSETKFAIFTDDWTAWHEMFPDLNSFEIGDPSLSYLFDFKFMKRCKHFITANSSFSLMAAILGTHPEKKIVCPKRWFGESMPEPYKSDTKDIYPNGAIII